MGQDLMEQSFQQFSCERQSLPQLCEYYIGYERLPCLPQNLLG